MYIDDSLKKYALVTKSRMPTPGGGSVSAYSGTLGAALTSMVGSLTVSKNVFQELDSDISKEIQESMTELDSLFEELAKIVDEDTSAFDEVIKAFAMPKTTDEEKQLRSAAIQTGYKKALEIPLRCAERCLRVLELQKVFAEYGNVNAISDIGVGALTAYTGCEGASLNVLINLRTIKDEEYKNKIKEEIQEILKSAGELKNETIKVVYQRLLG